MSDKKGPTRAELEAREKNREMLRAAKEVGSQAAKKFGNRELRREKPSREETYGQIAFASMQALQAFDEQKFNPAMQKIERVHKGLAIWGLIAFVWLTLLTIL